MARTTDQLSTRRTTATAQPATNVSGSFDEHDRLSGDNQLGDHAERRESLAAVRDRSDDERDDSRENRDERKPNDGHSEQSSRPEQPPMTSAGLDAFAPMLEAWKQVFKSWSELAETMMKVQRDAFASMIGAANTTAKDVNVELVSSGPRTTASTPDRIEHDRR
jgi:hypothetical protein